MKSRRRLGPGKKAGERHGRLPVHGESRFPHRRDPLYKAWLLAFDECVVQTVIRSLTRSELAEQGLQPCGFVPGRARIEHCHLRTQGSGGDDRANSFTACPIHHDEQEGRTKAFCARYGLDLYQIVLDLDAQYVRETGREEA